MKKLLAVLTLTAGLLTGVNYSAHAEAGTCSASDPCGTWAMLDNNNNVTNVIVCQTSVCGGGEWAGQKVVLQVPTKPNGNGEIEPLSYMSSPNNPVTYSPDTNQFSFSAGVNTTTETVNDDELTVSVGKRATVTAPSSINGDIPLVSYGTDYGTVMARNGLVSQSRTFPGGLTEEQMAFIIDNHAEDYIINRNRVEIIRLLISLGY